MDYYNHNEDIIQEFTRRRVNFKNKGSIDFSFSFLPGDVVTKHKQNMIALKMRTLEHIIGKYTSSSENLRQKFMKEIVANNINVPNSSKLK